jgi:hypothetical protein
VHWLNPERKGLEAYHGESIIEYGVSSSQLVQGAKFIAFYGSSCWRPASMNKSSKGWMDMNYAASRRGNKIIRRNENSRYFSGENMAFMRARAVQKGAQWGHALRVANNTQMVYCQDFSMIIMLFS